VDEVDEVDEVAEWTTVVEQEFVERDHTVLLRAGRTLANR